MDEQYQPYTIIGELLFRYPQLTETERSLLNEWANENPANRKLLDSVSKPEYLTALMQELEGHKSTTDHSWEKLRAHLGLSTSTIRELPRRNHWKRRWLPILAAACLLLAAGYLVFYYQHDNRMPPDQANNASKKPQDIGPGHYGARLTLSDGSEVLLDSANGNKVYQQGRSRLTSRSGELVYENAPADGETLYNTLTTGKGEVYALTLEDGSRIWLNSESSLRYPVVFSGNTRQVTITGEGYFEVAPSYVLNSRKEKIRQAFIVKANGLDISVIGTHFDVNSYNDEPLVKTSLIEGKVKVTANQGIASIMLNAGEQARYDISHSVLSKTKDQDVLAEAAWHLGYFQFNGANINTVMRQIQRWYDIEVEYKGAMAEKEFMGKIPRTLTLNQVLSILEKQGTHFQIDGKKIMVSTN